MRVLNPPPEGLEALGAWVLVLTVFAALPIMLAYLSFHPTTTYITRDCTEYERHMEREHSDTSNGW